MAPTIWTVISTSEIGSDIYPQDTASTTDKATAVSWAQTALENDATIMALEITGNDVRNATHEITEAAAELTLKAYEAKGFEADDMPDWVKATDAFDVWEGERDFSASDIEDIRADRWRDARLAWV